MNKIALFFLVTSLSMATTPVWAGNGAIPPKPIIILDGNTNKLNNPQEEKPEEKGSWFTKKNVGIAVVVILVATTLISKLGNDNTSSSSKRQIY